MKQAVANWSALYTKPRQGDAPALYADPLAAKQQLGWKTELNLDAMCHDAWNWQQKNPAGYSN